MAEQLFNQIVRVGEIRIGMSAAEVGERYAIDDRTGQRPEATFENFDGVGARDGVHRIEAHTEAAGEQAADGVEVEQRFHQRRVGGDGVHHIQA